MDAAVTDESAIVEPGATQQKPTPHSMPHDATRNLLNFLISENKKSFIFGKPGLR
jgi:hypothetical protein